MGEMVRTSRLKEAISCLQLYLHRCRLHQEEGIEVKPLFERQWPLLKSYRIWEANQRILLYPENYLKPELRKDKTPLFKTLEESLQQTDITDVNVETAFKKYLDGFSEIAQLKIIGSHVYVDPVFPDDKILVLVGRTHTDPAKIFYRTARCLANSPDMIWGAWKEIKVPIPSDHLYPVYAFGKLFLCWIEIKEETRSRKKPASTNDDREKHENIYAHHARLSYTFHDFNHGWSHPQQLGNNIRLQDWKPESIKAPDWARRLYPIYNNETKKELYIFYQQTSITTDEITYQSILKISPNLDLEILEKGAIPTSWIQNDLPKVGGDPVLVPDPDIKHYPITNQPDWFVFQAKDGTFLLRPVTNKKAISENIKVEYWSPPIPNVKSAIRRFPQHSPTN